MILSITPIVSWMIPVAITISLYFLFKYQLTLLASYKNKKNDNLNQKQVTSQKTLSKKIKKNDLKIIAGINPKIEGLFHVFGIKTWKDLGETSVEKCQKILKSVGGRYKIQKSNTWPKQAKLASEGKWEELEQWQTELTAIK